MKSSSLFAVLALAGACAHAADTGTLAVKATVPATCNFTNSGSASSNSYSMAFGNLSSQKEERTTDITFTCNDNNNGSRKLDLKSQTTTADVKFEVTTGGTLYAEMATTNNDRLKYKLDVPAATISGSGAANVYTFSVKGTIEKADIDNAPAGDYQDNVALTITP